LIIIRKPTLAESLLRFQTIQRIYRKENPADLTPPGCFITNLPNFALDHLSRAKNVQTPSAHCLTTAWQRRLRD
jgi:hypothetical protein